MALTYATALAAIKAHAVASGAALTNKILDVGVGPPLPVSSRCVRIFYGGEIESDKMGRASLASRHVGERIVLIAWVAVSNLSEQEIEAVETELYDFKHELRTRILGDSQLGGEATDLEMTMCEVDFVTTGNVRYRTLETELTTDFIDYAIAP